MRSFDEIRFRLRQEAANLLLFLRPPNWTGKPMPVEMPDPGQLEAGTTQETRWRRDSVNGIESGLDYFRLIPYLDFARVGDHKVVWEINRHQHLIALAQTGSLDEIRRQIADWERQNPYLRGINWASALEVAFRALSWIWVWKISGLTELLPGLYRHGCYLEHNLSVYFSPNTHLLGEAVALHALGVLFGVRRWEALGGEVTLEQMKRQVRGDGSHFEQSTYYHRYAQDFFRLHRVVRGGAPDWFDARLALMDEYLRAVTGPSGDLPLIGDDDGGWLLRDALEPGSDGSRLFPDAGLAVMQSQSGKLVIDAGPFGAGSAGHSHSDTLSLVAWAGSREVLVDAGTYTYVADRAARDWFRGSAAHNTVRVDGLDQAVPDGPFRWRQPPEVEVNEWRRDLLDAVCRYRGFTHRRRVLLRKPDEFEVVDRVEGPPGEHLVEQWWHPAEGVPCVGRAMESWRSRVFGSREKTMAYVVERRGSLPVEMRAVIRLGSAPEIR